eukprot:jgi/Botrbrau1/4091/Bobra.152_3s0041.2
MIGESRGPAAGANGDGSMPDVVIVGAGLAGLACGIHLTRRGLSVRILEAGDGVGGRVRTDEVEGFLLDRGFQIFLSSYPEARALLDYSALDLRPFYAGADVWYGRTFNRVADPFRHFLDAVKSLVDGNPIGTPQDKLLVGLFRITSLFKPVDVILSSEEMTTLERLEAEGFSQSIVDRFFRPFLGGIFFDRTLSVSSRLFEFVMRMLATGENCLPARGIGSISLQLAQQLPPGTIQLGAEVERVGGAASSGRGPYVTLVDGTTVQAGQAVVVATEGPVAERLLGLALEGYPSKPEPAVGTCNIYFRAPKAASPLNILYLNGTDTGIVNNACFPSTVAPSYAPSGQTLVSVSTIGTFPNLGDENLANVVKRELALWFGSASVDDWELLRVYRIPYAQPNQARPSQTAVLTL